MSIAANKKRISVTLDNETLTALDKLIANASNSWDTSKGTFDYYDVLPGDTRSSIIARAVRLYVNDRIDRGGDKAAH